MAEELESLPIDIHFNKLADWLVSRRHCKKEWGPVCMAIREKINAAILEMPAVEEIAALVESSNLNYFDCKKIVELMKRDTESAKTNIFGQYSSQKMKNWQEIMRLFEKDDNYLVDTAQMIARNVNYEIPALKKQVAKCQQTQKECTRKEADYLSSAAELRKQYEHSCKQMGIQGNKIKSEFAALVRDLPMEFAMIAEQTKELEPAVDYYKKFLEHTLHRSGLEGETLPMLCCVQSKGNVTTYQWRHGKAPQRIEERRLIIDTTDEDDQVDNPDTIDWDAAEDTIDFGDVDISSITVEGGGAETQQGDGIDWGDGDVVMVTSDDVADADDGVARGKDAVSVMENPDTRCLFLDDLYELEAFLKQRLVEMRGGDGGGNVLQGEPAHIQLSPDLVSTMLSSTSSIISVLSSVRLQHLLLIHDSPRYVDRLRDSLKQKLALADKMVFREKEMVERRRQALAEERMLEPRVQDLVQKTRAMQKQVEEEITKRYKGRRVNIMGEINTL